VRGSPLLLVHCRQPLLPAPQSVLVGRGRSYDPVLPPIGFLLGVGRERRGELPIEGLAQASLLVRVQDDGDRLCIARQKLGDKSAILMRGHGFAAVGKSLPFVVGRSIYIGVAAKLQAEAIALGGTVTYLDPEEGRKIEARRDYIRPWELWKSQAMGK